MIPTLRHRKQVLCKAQEAGFTLVEVLVALTIVGVALAAFARMTSQTTTNLERIEQRTLAMLSAENSISELRIANLPAPGIQLIECPQADRAFVCRVQVGRSQQGIRAVSVEVYADRNSDQRLASLQTHLPESRQ